MINHLKFYTGVILLASFAVSAAVAPAWADSIDPTSIATILGEKEPSAPAPADPGNKKLIQGLANVATKSLDANNQDWTPSNAKWKIVYNRVHADFVKEMPETGSASEMNGSIAQSYEKDIAAHMTQADVDAILTFYKTPQGQRYQDFLQRIDKIMGDGISHVGAPTTAEAPTPEDVERYSKMLALSRVYQSMNAMMSNRPGQSHDASGYGPIGLALGIIVRKSQPELAAIYKDYAADLPAFEIFNETDAPQHLFAAMGVAIPNMIRNANPAAKALAMVEAKHRKEWQDFYQRQTAP